MNTRGAVSLWIASLTLVAAATMLLISFYWLLWPFAGLQVVHHPFPVMVASVRAGQALEYKVEYCVDARLPLPLDTTRLLELQGNGAEFPLPGLSYIITERCETRLRYVEIPSYVPAGRYHVHILTAIEVNPLRTIRQSFQTADFEVVK